jgi:hypothetical protein
VSALVVAFAGACLVASAPQRPPLMAGLAVRPGVKAEQAAGLAGGQREQLMAAAAGYYRRRAIRSGRRESLSTGCRPPVCPGRRARPGPRGDRPDRHPQGARAARRRSGRARTTRGIRQEHRRPGTVGLHPAAHRRAQRGGRRRAQARPHHRRAEIATDYYGVADVAAWFGVAPATVTKWLTRYTGWPEPDAYGVPGRNGDKDKLWLPSSETAWRAW